MDITQKQARQIIFVVVAMTFILGFGIDLYAPSFPAIKASLHTTSQFVQLTIATYFLGYVVGQLFMGPLSDALGRKKPLIFGLIFYAIMSFICSLSTNISTLLFLRFLQGIGVASVGVMCRSILGDSFTGKRLATSMSYFSMSYRIGPIIAPFLGGYLEFYFGWQSNFYFLTLYSILIICMILFFLPETHLTRIPFQPKTLLRKYAALFKYRTFVGGSVCIGILYAMMIIFNVVGPFFIQDVLHYTPISYGHIALLIGICSFIGILSNRFFIQHRSSTSMIAVGIYSVLILSILQVIFAFIFPVSLMCFIIPVILILFASGFINSNVMSHILDLIPQGKGVASALLGIIIICCTGTLTALSSFLESSTVRPFALAYFAMALASFLSYQFLFKKKH